MAIVGSLFSSIFSARLADSAFAATGKASVAGDSVPTAFGIAAAHPELLVAVQHSFLSGITTACTVVAALCYTAAAAGVIALPGRRFQPPVVATDTAHEPDPRAAVAQQA